MTHWDRTSGGSGLTLARKEPSGIEPVHTLATDKDPLESNWYGGAYSKRYTVYEITLSVTILY
jgi:hypothetical protein